MTRHGRPQVDHWVWVAPHQFRHWIEVWDSADISADGVPSETKKLAAESAVIVSSTLRRSIQSAKYLGGSNSIVADPIFCEARIPYLDWRMPYLPLWLWAGVLRIAWFLGYSTHAESHSVVAARAGVAAEKLIALAAKHDSVLLVGHGIMTMLIARHLQLLGWRGPKRPIKNYWQSCVYESPALNSDHVAKVS